MCRSIISFANMKWEGETVVIVQSLFTKQVEGSIVSKEYAAYEVRPRCAPRFKSLCLISCSFRCGLNGPLRGVNEFWNSRCAVFQSLLFCCSRTRLHSQMLNLLSVLEQKESAWAHVLEVHMVIGCGLSRQHVSRDENVGIGSTFLISLTDAPRTLGQV